jgi:hypothetical protein
MPWLTCQECQDLAERNPEYCTYPCAVCPNRLLAEAGPVTHLAVEVYQLLAVNPLPESPPTWETLFEMVGITRPHLKRAVYERVAAMVQWERAHHKADETKSDRTITNPAA